ncbi:MAG: major capsid protein [Desulfobulbaceae bacterium]|nr:major capsid protein [Desulfobulbaceae bacterium]
MSIMLDMFDSRSMTAAVNKTKVFDPFVLDMLFSKPEGHAADKIDLEVISHSDKLAKFVNQHEGPRLLQKDNRVYQTVSLPRTYEEYIFTAQELADYNAFGQIYDQNPGRKAEEANKFVVRHLEYLKSRAMLRREWMACKAISTGEVAVAQTNISFNIDYLFENNVHLTDLGAGNYWDDETGDILTNIRAWKRDILRRCGQSPDIVILGTDASDAFVSNEVVKKALDTNNYKIGTLDLNATQSGAANYLGKIMGIDFYEYNQQFKDDNDTSTELIPVDRAIVTFRKNSNNRVHYGPVYNLVNKKLQTIISEFHLDVEEKNKKAMSWTLEQKSLPAIHDADSFISCKVVGD